MDEINYPTAYALYEIKKYIGHDMCGLPIIDTDCFVVMPCYITKHTVKYDYDGIADEALAKKFGITKEFAHEVMNFYYYPKIYYMSSSDFYE